ncbi:MAG: hypothetical protein OXI01_11525 [Albidovulum sp.]|nr:hypothetical protein [Albidovulum sp.]
MSPAPRLVRTTRAVEPGLAASVGRLQQLADVGGPEVLEDARGGGHAAVADQGDAGDAEAGAHLGDLRGQRGGVARVAGVRLHRHGAAVRGAQKPVRGLLLALLAVAVVAEGRERAAPPLEVAA